MYTTIPRYEAAVLFLQQLLAFFALIVYNTSNLLIFSMRLLMSEVSAIVNQEKEDGVSNSVFCREAILTTGLMENMKKLEANRLLSWTELEQIWADYLASKEEIDSVCNCLVLELQKLGHYSYHYKVRPKKPVSLIRKIVQNAWDNREKYGSVNSVTYKKFITDLIGARILIRAKSDWKQVHDQLVEAFDRSPREKIAKATDYLELYIDDPTIVYFAEEPVAYYVSKDEEKSYLRDGKNIIATKESDHGYRSIHYIVKYMNYYVEIQVRSIFEEGWSECDHDLAYKNPDPVKRENLKRLSKILSEISHQADELIEYMVFMK
jgi:ppGpp synthetase/RelA/SpoT-type nucleotidyltranferase